MSIRTFLLGLGNVLRGTPKALHLASMKQAIAADYTRTVTKAADDFNDAKSRIDNAIHDEVEVAKTLVNAAHERLAALEDSRLLSDVEHLRISEVVADLHDKVFPAP